MRTFSKGVKVTPIFDKIWPESARSIRSKGGILVKTDVLVIAQTEGTRDGEQVLTFTRNDLACYKYNAAFFKKAD